jgi:predicted transporter
MTELRWLKKGELVILVVAVVIGVAFVYSGFRFISREDTVLRFALGGLFLVGSGVYIRDQWRVRHTTS